MSAIANCSICKRVLTRNWNPKTPEAFDCGGDCLECMARVGNDPDCIDAMQTAKQLREALERLADK